MQDYQPFGMGIPERSWAAEEVRFGFNGQLRTPEIQADHHTAEFWEYSPRTVMRWNTDPVVKHESSPYAVLSGNPVWRIDPEGNDDYFFANGRFSHSTKTGTQIRILSEDTKSSSLLSEINLKDQANWQRVANVVGHYGVQVGITSKMGISPNSGKPKASLAYTNSEGIWINAQHGIHPILNDFRNMKSTLVHEKFHWEEPKETREFYKFSDHAQVYLSQFKDKSFQETTQELKIMLGLSFAGYLASAFNKEEINEDKLQ